MSTRRFWLLSILLFSGISCANAYGDGLSQTFESGEDTSNWGSTWSNGSVVAGFLDPSIGGQYAGSGASVDQSFSRSFLNNTAGVSLTLPYTISLYTEVNISSNPSSWLFEIVNGSYGSGNAANLQIFQTSPGNYVWQARDNNNGWQNLGLSFSLGQPYYVQLSVNPANFTYNATVSQVTTTGSVVSSATLTNLAFDQNVINNQQNGQLLFYIQASSGVVSAEVDNINITNIPEPSTSALMLVSGAMLCASVYGSRRRKLRASAARSAITGS